MSELRQALGRVSQQEGGVILPHVPVMTGYGTVQLGSDLSGQMMPVPRFPIQRVEIKTEVAAFIDAHFQARTSTDGVVLSLSKEVLVEQLTALFYGLEERSAQVDDRFSTSGQPAKAKRSPRDEDRSQDRN